MIRFVKATKIAVFSLCISIFGTVRAQDIASNVRVQPTEEYLMVIYDLAERADIEVHISFDGAASFSGPLRHVTGAVGKDIAAEKDKIIMWHALAEIGEVDLDNVVIKIVATVIAPEQPPVEPPVELPVEKPLKHQRFHITLALGARQYGATGLGKTSGGVAVADFEAAYFFKPRVGIGIKGNWGVAEVAAYGHEGNHVFDYQDEAIFLGAALYARTGNRNLQLTASIAAGVTLMSMWDNYDNFWHTATYESLLLSAGINMKLTRRTGIALNANYLLTPDLFDASGRMYDRKPNALGAVAGINFSF